MTPVYPFIEDGIVKADVTRILEESGLGFPEYYKWRSRSGCYFCFFQQKIEWVGLLENHPDLFEKAKEYENFHLDHGRRYTWSQSESLEELEKPERIEKIKKDFKIREEKEREKKNNHLLVDMFSIEEDDDDSCLICHL
jgi:hypothetical protein